MKILAIFLFAFTAIFNSPSVTNTETILTTSTQPENKAILSGIIMEEIIMLANSGDDDNPIVGVKIYNELKQKLVYEDSGCFAPFCSFNLAHLPAGTYFAVVQTENGQSFSAFIDVQ